MSVDQSESSILNVDQSGDRREGTDDSESRRVRYVREAGGSSVASNIVEEVRNAKAVVDKYFSKVRRIDISLRFSSS